MAKCWPKQICVHRFTLGDKSYFHWNFVYFMMWSEQLMHLFGNNNRYEYWKWQTFEKNLNPLKAVKNKYLILSFHDCDVKISLYSVVCIWSCKYAMCTADEHLDHRRWLYDITQRTHYGFSKQNTGVRQSERRLDRVTIIPTTPFSIPVILSFNSLWKHATVKHLSSHSYKTHTMILFSNLTKTGAK